MRRRLTSIFLAAVLAMTSADVTVFAVEHATEAEATTETQETDETGEEKEGETSQPSETETESSKTETESSETETESSETETESSKTESSETETEEETELTETETETTVEMTEDEESTVLEGGENIASGVVDNWGHIEWAIDASGKLTVNGWGDFEDPSLDEFVRRPPWYANRLNIGSAEINVTGMTNASDMFYECRHLKSLDLSDFDTSKVTNMGYMFYLCDGITSLDLSDFDTSKVTNMESMFYKCFKITSLNVSNFDTSKVTNMNRMFFKLVFLTGLDLSNFNTSQVRYMDNMFNECYALTSLDLSSFDTSQVKRMWGMFNKCNSLTNLDLSNFDISQVYTMAYMFSECSSLTSMIIPEGVTNIENYTFYSCSSLTSVSIPKNVTSIGIYAFDECPKLKDVFYGGTKEDWLKISIGNYNSYLKNATIHYNSTMPDNISTFTISDSATGVVNGTIDISGEITMLDAAKASSALLNTAIRGIKWTSSDKTIAEVTKCVGTNAADNRSSTLSITVTPYKAGKVTITGTTSSGLTASCEISVEERDNYNEAEALFVQEHLQFVNSSKYSERMNARWAKIISNGLDTPAAKTAESIYKVLNTGSELASCKALSVFENPYDAIIVQLILLQTDVNMEAYNRSYETELSKYVSLFSDIGGILEYSSDDWEMDMSEYKTYLEKLIAAPESMKEAHPVFYDWCTEKLRTSTSTTKKLESLLNGYGKFETFLSAVDDYSNVVEWVSDCIKYNSSVSAYLSTSDEFKASLYAAEYFMTANLSGDSYVSRTAYAIRYGQAVKKYMDFMTEDRVADLLFEEYMSNGLKRVVDVFGDTVKKNALVYVSEGLGISTKAVYWLYAAIKAYKNGWEISEAITDNGTNFECRELARASYYLEDAMVYQAESAAEILKKNENFQSAKNFDAAYTILQNLECYALDNYIKYLSAQQKSFVQGIVHGIVHGFNFKYNGTEIEICNELELEWKNTCCHNGVYGNVDLPQITTIKICCPTDVKVYDENSNLVFATQNNKITQELRQAAGSVIGEMKFIAVPNMEKYKVEINATDDGKMGVFVDNYDLKVGTRINSYAYADVDIVKNNSYNLEYKNSNVVLKYDTNIVQPTGIAGEEEKVKISSVVINEIPRKLKTGESVRISATITPSNAFCPVVSWSSSDNSIAAIDENGNLVAKDEGIVKISCCAIDGSGVVQIAEIHIEDNSSEAENYTITFDTKNRGTAPEPYTNIKAGSTITPPPEPTAESYTFTGWYKDAACNTLWNFATDVVTSDITLYAGWKAADKEPDKPDIDFGDVLPEDIPANGKIPSGLWIAGVKDFTYTGKAVTQDMRVYDSKKMLKQGQDYTVSYKNNIKANGASNQSTAPAVIVKGKDNYSGTETATFKILTVDIAGEEVHVNDFFVKTGKKAVKPVPELYYMGTKLKNKSDFTVSYSNASNIYSQEGEYEVTVTGKGNYTGTRKLKLVAVETVVKATPVSIEKATLSGFEKTFAYTGAACTQKCTLTVKTSDGDKTLVEGTDYTTGYTNNVKAGTATVTYYGRNGYTGKLKKTYKIQPYDINENAGAKIKYDGNLTCVYAKGGSRPRPVVRYDGKTLTEGVDYTLSWANNDAVSGNKTPCITIVGKGCFTGKIPVNFTITPQDLSKMTLASGDKVYQKKANIYKITPKLTDLDGKQLSAGKDYDTRSITYSYEGDVVLENGVTKKKGDAVEKTDIIPADTEIRVVISAGSSGNYKETFTGTYRITKASISTAVVTIPKQTYTGSEITPDKKQLKVKIGKTTLAEKDYDIVGYTNNVKKGTAYATIRGKGNYGGTKKAAFTIKAKGFLWWWRK